MIESEPIPAGDRNWIRICLIEDDYRIRVTDLVGNILFELEQEEIHKFHHVFNTILLSIQELQGLDKKKKEIQTQIKKPDYSKKVFLEKEKENPEKIQVPIEENYSTRERKRDIRLINLYPKLSGQELEYCILAIKEKKKLSEKVTIGIENLEDFLLGAFDGQKITVSKIMNICSESSISVLKDSLRKTLDEMVQEGKITSSKEKTRQGFEYVLYSINFSAVQQRNTFEMLLDSLEDEFSTKVFLKKASEKGIEEKEAKKMLEQSHQKGEVAEIRQEVYKKIE